MRQEATGSRLYYFGTRDDIRIGDRVRMKRFLRRDLSGVVCSIPGISARNGSLEDEFPGIREWAVRGDNGSVYSILYAPEQFQPPKSIVLIGRGNGGELLPEEPLE